jgi:hypothetical protein
MKTDHIYRRFSNNIVDIKELLRKDTTFREICDNYEEICTWLDNYCRSQSRPSTECDHAREVVRNLENEINKVLKGTGL